MRFGAGALFFLAALLFLALQASAQIPGIPNPATPSPCANTAVAQYSIFNLIGYSLLGLIVSIDVVAIGYIIGRLVPSTGIRNWISEEYLEIAKTAMLIVGIFSVLVFMSNIAVILAPPGTGTGSLAGNVESLAGQACNYLNYISDSQSGLPTTLDYMLSLAGTIGALQGLTIGFWVPIPVPPLSPVVWFEFGWQYQPYVNPMFESTLITGAQESTVNDMFTYIVFPIGFILLAQQSLLPALVALGFVFLIPFGIALRSFPFIRGIGGTLIAIGIGLSLIYPSVLVLLNWPVTNALSFGSYSSTAPAPNCASNPALCFVLNLVSPGTEAAAAGVSDGVAAVYPYTIFNAMNGMLFYAFYLILQFLLFIADIAIAYPLTDSIARTLGGTIRLQIGGKFKLA